MTSKDSRPKQATELRRQAEEIAREKTSKIPEDRKGLSPDETRQTVHELQVHQIELEMQNEELRRAQTELDAARARYFDLYDLAPVGYCTVSEKGLILEANLTAATLLGVTRGALVMQSITRFILKEDQDIYYRHRKLLFDSGEPQSCELRMLKKDETVFWGHLAATTAQDIDGAPICRIVMSDITERKWAEETLKKSQRLLAETERVGKVGGWEFNIDSGKQTWTEEIYNIHEVDLTFDPTVEKGIHFYAPASRPIIERAVQRTLEHGEPFDVELEIITAKGNLRSVHAIGRADMEHRRVYGFFQDITERKQAENLGMLARKVLDILNKPKGSLDTIRSILHLIKKCLNFQAVGIRLKEGDDFPYYETNGFPEDFVRAEKYLCAYDEEGKIVRDSKGNSLLECMCGNIISGRTDAALPFFTKDGSFWTNSTTDLLASTIEKDRQARTRNRCNGEGYESVALIPLHGGDEVIGLLQMNDCRRNMFTLKMINFFEDLGSSIGIALTRKRIEECLKEALEKYRSLAAYVDSMYLVDMECTYLFMNDRHLERFGLSLEEVVGKKYSEFHTEEDAKRFAEDVNEVCQIGNPITKEHRSERDGKFFLRTFTPIIGQGSNGKISQVAVISKEITNIKLAEKNLRETLESLRKAVNTTIRVMVAAVETRDPYTAGHQMRSADLARAIATEMGLPQDKIEGIRMAGSIHDIGKLSIPAEILSKPTALSSIELLLIKEHAQRGYEILKDVESPWPLAEIVHQHHERMDGSGYPRNLRGEEILLESRILTVSDVVEAMASHRPYRAGLGIDAALNEIEKNRGIFYDNTAADACLRLFREKGFKLEGT